MRRLVIWCCLGLMGTTAIAGERAADYKEKVSGLLPEGWTVVAVRDAMIVRRMEPVPLAETTSGVSGKSKYTLRLRFEDRIAPGQYARLYASQKGVRDRLAQLEKALKDVRVEDGKLKPADSEQSRLVLEYETAKKAASRLPAYYDDQVSLRIERPDMKIADPVAKECAMVEQKVLGLFNPYVTKQPASGPTKAPVHVGLSVRQALDYVELKDVRFRAMSLEDVFKVLDDKLVAVTGGRVVPTIWQLKLSEETRSQKVTMSMTSVKARDLLDRLCGLYDIRWSVERQQIILRER